MLLRQPLELVVVEQRVLLAHAVGDDVVEAAGEVDLHAVREVAAVVELHPEHGVARLAERVVDRRVRLRARVRLDVHVLGAEERAGPLDRERLDDVHVLAAAVVALAGVALGVLVRQHRALAVEHRLRHEVLRRDHLERRLLPPELGLHRLGDLGIDVGDGLREVIGRQLAHLRAKLPK